jgi:hypothetical protein
VTIAWLVASLAGVAGAQPTDGLGRALDQQRQDLQRQQSETQREIEAQGRALQQQQNWRLREQLDQRSQEPRPPERPLTCPPGAVVCD